MTGWKWRVLRVIEGGACPIGRVMAGLARRREELRLRGVARVRRIGVVGLMTSVAGRWQGRVIAIGMAIGALPWRYGMRASQREHGVVVIEG